MQRGVQKTYEAAKKFGQNFARQSRNYTSNYDCMTRHNGPRQYGQGSPYFLGYWHAGTERSILERAGWALFFFVPVEAAYLFYDFGYRRVDAEMGPWISDNSRYDGTEYDETEKEVRYRWATDGTMCQYKQEHAEKAAKESLVMQAKLRLELKAERGQL